MERPHRTHYDITTPGDCIYHSAIDIWVYEPLLDKWTRKISGGDIPLQLSGACAAVDDQYMYLFGGYHNGENYDLEGNWNTLWRLHLPSYTWTQLEPEGTPPFACDKAVCWVHDKRYYVFGGFGPPIEYEKQPPVHVNFVNDDSTAFNIRGWIDQLVYYDIELNKWVWPKTTGCPPCPRAAHAADVTGDRVYIFGGRHRNLRMNDLHCLDFKTMRWSGNLAIQSPEFLPEGRSWHSFKFISHDKAIVYGGFNEKCQVLSDVWVLELAAFTWLRTKDNASAGKRLWHSAASSDQGEIHVHGGFRNNLLDLSQPRDHAEEMVCLRFSPPTLQRLLIERLCQDDLKQNLEPYWKLLPHHLQHILNSRTSDLRYS